MKFSVVWMDRESAHIFHLSNDQMERKKVTVSHHEHHTHKRDQFDVAREEPRLFKEVVAELKDSDRLLVVGPGVAKHHFHAYLNEHQPFFGKKVVGIETVDHPTDNQIAAMARKFLEKVSA